MSSDSNDMTCIDERHPASAQQRTTAERMALSSRYALMGHALRQLDDAMAQAGISACLLKGMALIPDLYPKPWERPCQDIDLLIQKADWPRTHQLLRELGLDGGQADAPRGLHASEYIWTIGQSRVAIDLHWRISQTPCFDAALPTEAILERSQPRVGYQSLRQPDTADRLLHACLHRRKSLMADMKDRPLWLEDCDRLVRHLTDEDAEAFLSRARDGHVLSIGAEALLLTEQQWGTPIPTAWKEAWQRPEVANEPAARYLKLGRFGAMIEDLRQARSFTERWHLLRTQLAPAGSELSIDDIALWLPLHYVWRVVRLPFRLLREYASKRS